MRKEGLLYPACLGVVLGWGTFFACYELLAGDAELDADRARKVLIAMQAFRGKPTGLEDDLLDVRLFEFRRMSTVSALETAVRATRPASITAAAVAGIVGLLLFFIAKPRRASRE